MTRTTKPIVVDVREGYLWVTLPAYESPEKKKEQISAVYDAVHEHNARRLLIDCRSTKRLIPVLDLYDLCLSMVSTFGPVDIRIAVLVSPEAAYPDRCNEKPRPRPHQVHGRRAQHARVALVGQEGAAALTARVEPQSSDSSTCATRSSTARV